MNRLVEVISVGVTAGGLAYGAVACGGGDNNSPTPDVTKIPIATVLETNSPMPSQTALATATQTLESPTPVITATEKPVIPSFEKLSFSVDAAISSFGYTTLPDPAQSVEQLHQTLDNCNEKGLEGAAPEVYGTAILNGCVGVSQELVNMYHQNPTPEIKAALEQIQAYTLGPGGKLDQLVTSGKITYISDVSSYKSQLQSRFFTP